MISEFDILVESAKSNFKISDVNLTYPYYIYYSDQSGYSFVTIKLNGTNYQFGSKSIMHALIAKKKIGFIVQLKNRLKMQILPNLNSKISAIV